jgi:hypothetical protein
LLGDGEGVFEADAQLAGMDVAGSSVKVMPAASLVAFPRTIHGQARRRAAERRPLGG